MCEPGLPQQIGSLPSSHGGAENKPFINVVLGGECPWHWSWQLEVSPEELEDSADTVVYRTKLSREKVWEWECSFQSAQTLGLSQV